MSVLLVQDSERIWEVRSTEPEGAMVSPEKVRYTQPTQHELDIARAKQIEVVRGLDNGVWQDYVDRNPLGNIFHTPQMFEVLARTKNYRPSLWSAVGESGEPLALLSPVAITLMNGPMRLLSSRAVAYGSALCDTSSEGYAALYQLLMTYRQSVGASLLFTELRHLADQSAIRSLLSECGFEHEGHLNYLIDLRQPKEAIWKKVASRTRSYIRSGLKRDELTIQEVNTPAALRDAYELLCKTYAHARVPLADFSLFQAIYEVLRPQKMARITSVYINGAPAATSIDLLYKGVVYYWYGGMDRAFGSFHPSEVLRWHVIEWAWDNGYRLFDFGGAGKPDEQYSVRDFKAKFGGELVDLGRSVCVHAPQLLSLSKRGYELYRGLRAMMAGRDTAKQNGQPEPVAERA